MKFLAFIVRWRFRVKLSSGILRKNREKEFRAIFDFAPNFGFFFSQFSVHSETHISLWHFTSARSRISPRIHEMGKSGKWSKTAFFVINRAGNAQSEREGNVTNSVVNWWCLDVSSKFSFLIVTRAKKNEPSNNETSFTTLISAVPSSFISFSRNFQLPSSDTNFKDKSFVCKLCATWIEAMQKKRRGKLSSRYGHRVMSVCLCVCTCFSSPHPSTNMAMQFETINHLFMIINNLLSLSTLSTSLRSTNEREIVEIKQRRTESDNLFFAAAVVCLLENNYELLSN